MGVDLSINFVDWAALQEQWGSDPDALRNDVFYDNEVDDGWPGRFKAHYWDNPSWISGWHSAAAAEDHYDALRLDLSECERSSWDRLFAILFQRNRKPTAFDLPGFVPGERLYNVLSPASVAQLASEVRRLDVERLRGPFEARFRRDPGQRLSSFDDFRGYLHQWVTAIEAADRSAQAAVIWISL